MPAVAAPLARLTADQQELVRTHQRFVIHVVSRYFRNGAQEDIIAEGNVGLCIAATRFDPSRGFTFRTYAFHWIRAMALNYVMRNRGPVRFGGLNGERKVFLNIGRALTALGADQAHDSEKMAAFIGVDVDTFERMRKRLGYYDVALDAERAPDDERPILELRDTAEPAEDQVARREKNEHDKIMITKALTVLDDRSRKILRWRHMRTEPLPPLTLAQIGRRLGLSRERVRQLEARALKQLKKELVKLVYQIDG